MKTEDFNYILPEEKIAMYPLPERDMAKMLVYRNGKISHGVFRQLIDYLPEHCTLVFNDTKVVQARLIFQRETGANIEVFCLNPISPYKEMSQAMQAKGTIIWECMAGNSKRWKEGETLLLELNGSTLYATLLGKTGREVKVEFSWSDATKSWAEILEQAGKIPLPPYIHRDADDQDRQEYQTVYAEKEGAVAAPTAGLHFTEELITKLKINSIGIEKVTLHVGAGTFQPVEAENIIEHKMHNEQIVFTKKAIERLQKNPNNLIAVGTTSLRALESLYWFGALLQFDKEVHEFFIPKLLPYELKGQLPNREESLQTILDWMESKEIDNLWGQTEIFIFPGYKFRMINGLITNFHLPKSTLLMLIAAFVGDDWKRIYTEALAHNYRFLSYGDGSLLYPKV